VRLLRSFALSLASSSILGLGCAYGSSVRHDGVSQQDTTTCASYDCDAVDSGTYDAAQYPDAYSTGDSGIVTVEPDSGVVEPDSAEPVRDAVAPEDRAVVFDTGPTCTLTLGTGIAACDTCLGASCCSVDNACGSDPSCLAFSSCLATCEGMSPYGPYGPYGAGGRDAGVRGARDAGAGDADDAGDAADADAADADLDADADVDAEIESDAGVAGCVAACEREYPTGAVELENLDSCLEGTCATECEAP
jgi:hypothetical protein